MITFLGLTALAFFTLLIGWVWRPKELPLEAQLTFLFFDGIVKSLWIGWIFVFVLATFQVTPAWVIWTLSFLTMAVAMVLTRQRKIRLQFSEWGALLGIFLLVGILAIVAFWQGIYEYDRIFGRWDALVSWNRWAIELSENRYVPYNAAYPVLLPGLWSLVYRFQGTSEVWFFAKLSLFIQPLMLGLFSLLLWRLRQRLIAVVFFAGSGWLLFFYMSDKNFLTGYMDGPVAVLMLLGFCSLLLVIDAVRINNEDLLGTYLLGASLLVGLAAITKQAGFILIVLYGAALTLLIIQKRVSLRKGSIYFGFSVLPLTLFVTLFLETGRQPFGTLAVLQSLTDQSAEGYYSAIGNAIRMIGDQGGWIVVPGLIFLSLLNFLKARSLSGQIGIIGLVGAVVGLFIYADCCAYDQRNGWWIVSLLGGSALFGLSCIVPERGVMQDENRVSRRTCIVSVSSLFALVTITLVLLSVIIGALITDHRIRSMHATNQWHLVSGSETVRDLLDRIEDKVVVVSDYDRLAYLPQKAMGKIRFCGGSSEKIEQCIVKISREASSENVFFLLSREFEIPPGFMALMDDDSLLEQHKYWWIYGPKSTR